MEVAAAEARLKAMLNEGGFDTKRPTPSIAWAVFKSFTQEQVACAEDGVLFQCGVYDFSGKDHFYLDFVRQFTIDVDGEYDHMEQLHIEFTCEPTKQLASLATNLWAEECPSLTVFFNQVETLAEFKLAISHSPWKCKVHQHQV